MSLVGTPSTQPTNNEATAPPVKDTTALMEKMAEQQRMIDQLTKALESKNSQVDNLSKEKRQEMKSVLEGMITNWLNNVDADEKARNDFKSGLDRLAENAESNGIWEVVVSASTLHARDRANAQEKEEAFQRLQTEYKDLKLKMDGGSFSHEDSRVGLKRRAADEPHPVGGGVDMWAQFSTLMGGENGFSTQTFQPSL